MKTLIEVNDEIVLLTASPNCYQQKYEAVMRSRDHLLPWLPWVYFYDTHGAEGMKEYQEGKAMEFANDENYAFDIFYKGEFAGCIEIMHISEVNHNCELGYWLDVEKAGKGIITQVVRFVTKLAFEEMGMHLVLIRAAQDNAKSCNVARRCGFELDAVLPERLLLGGEWHNECVFSKIRKG